MVLPEVRGDWRLDLKAAERAGLRGGGGKGHGGQGRVKEKMCTTQGALSSGFSYR